VALPFVRGYSAAPLPAKAKVNRPPPSGEGGGGALARNLRERGGPGLDRNRAAEW